VTQEKHEIDCLILQDDPELPKITHWLHGQAILLPAVLMHDTVSSVSEPSLVAVPTSSSISVTTDDEARQPDLSFLYHTAEVRAIPTQLNRLYDHLEQAIAQFLGLSPACRLPLPPESLAIPPELALQNLQNFLMLQQHRLKDKLKERLGYLGVYYKRNPKNFLRHLPPSQKQELLSRLRAEYQEIVLNYFNDDGNLNRQIDDFVNTAFFTDLPVAQVVEIHMQLMDEFSKQLKMEGRSEDILLDYRLTLIDTIAHLCEMYRRSIPRES
jgi:circadian clock protein KaiA